jgi:hypothetical protein
MVMGILCLAYIAYEVRDDHKLGLESRVTALEQRMAYLLPYSYGCVGCHERGRR